MTNLRDIDSLLSDTDKQNRSERIKKNILGSGEPPDMSLESRVARLEASAEHIQFDISEIKMDIRDIKSVMREEFSSVRKEHAFDFRLLFGAVIATTLGLAGIMAKGFGWL